MITEPELLNERLERLAMVLDEIMPNCAFLVRDALELLKEQPPIVRCKDCKWRGTNACFCKAKNDVQDDWFCSEGERRKEQT